MPKVTISFNLPEECDDFKLATNGHNFYGALFEFDNYLRKQLKYNEDKLSDEQYELIEKIRNKLAEIIYEQTGIYDIMSYVE
ncbi:MAG: hypothetical protein M1326_08010 [Cyanobacteria bacterium]|nr:hypothetical protein [Cyanobacteriota bacterium]